jgi:hypothetical protein
MSGLFDLLPAMLAASAPAAAAETAAAALPAAAGAAAAPTIGGLSGLLSQTPALTTGLQSMGLLGSVTDATGGLATSTTAANNIGGGLLGKSSAAFMSPDKLMKAGMLLSSPQQQQVPLQAQPFSFQSQPTNLSQDAQSPMSEQEKRRRMLAQIFQGG